MVTADSSQSGRVKELGKLFDRGDPIFPKTMLSKDSSRSSTVSHNVHNKQHICFHDYLHFVSHCFVVSGDSSPMSVRKFRAIFETDQSAASKTHNQGTFISQLKTFAVRKKRKRLHIFCLFLATFVSLLRMLSYSLLH